MMSTTKNVVGMHWFRKGLRLHDNPALIACLEQEPKKFYPVYVLDGNSYQLLRCTPIRANFLIECLQDLDQNLRNLGSRLYVLNGDPVDVLPKMWKEWDISHLSFEEDESGEPYALQRDETIVQKAQDAMINVTGFCSETMYPLKSYVAGKGKGAGKYPGTMSAFQRVFGNMKPMQRLKSAPEKDHFLDNQDSKEMSELFLPPRKPTDLPWPRGIPKSEIEDVWNAEDCKGLNPIVHGGETLALLLLEKSLSDAKWVANFEKPKTSCTTLTPSTTGLSPYLSWGCLSSRQVWFAVEEALARTSLNCTKPPVSLHGQLLWREYNYLTAFDANNHQPGSWNKIQGNKYCRDIPWDTDQEMLESWKDGMTGYPWIDACMRQLKAEGWIHHLGRHAVACFLTRGDLWQSWEKGASHFESHLLDADYALNGFNWMWLSCSGFFYQYFRCYSPVAFQKKNDPNGNYIRKYVPELKELPKKYIYEPWDAPLDVQRKAGVVMGKSYPLPIVEHKTISKENMSRMADAYAAHKRKESPGYVEGNDIPSVKPKKKQKNTLISQQIGIKRYLK